MGCWSPDAPAPVNYGKETADALNAQIKLAPQLYASEANSNYGEPAYAGLSLGVLNTLMNGSPGGTQSYTSTTKAGQTGWYDANGNFVSPGQVVDPNPRLGPNGRPLAGARAAAQAAFGPQYTPGTAPSNGAVWYNKGASISVPHTQTTSGSPGLLQLMQDQNTSQRSGDISDVMRLGPEATAAMLNANPWSAQLLAMLNGQAQDELTAGSHLTPDEQRAMQQQSRAAFAARGMGDSGGAVADELLRQFNLGQQLLQQRQQFAGNVLGYNQAVIGDPFQQILNRPSTTVNTAAAMQPGRQFNPESPLAASIASGNQQMAAMFADPSTISKVGAVSSIAGKFIGSVAGAAV